LSKIIMGMDEAGRGSLVGPMVVAAVVINDSDESFLRELGVRDSKKLRKEKRKELFPKIVSTARWYGFVIVTPEQIDSGNLNSLTIEAYRRLACSALAANLVPDVAIADAVGSREGEFRACIQVKIRMEKKADSKHIAVGAASILAKVIRDREVEKIREAYGLKGSGYPGDKNTRMWLMENPGSLPPNLVRHKWRSEANPYSRKM